MEFERTFQQWSIEGPRVQWSAIFAGWAVGLAVQMVMTLMGLGFGAWAVDLSDSEPAGGLSLGAGIWTGISVLISAFIGGYVTSRLSGSVVRSSGIYHGVVVWGVNWLVFAWLMTTAMATMIGGVFSAFGTTIQTLGQGVGSAVSKMGGSMPLSGEEIRRQIESILRATGKAELQPGELHRDADRVTGSARSGQPLSRTSEAARAELQEKLLALDGEAAVNILVNKFGFSETQARDIVQSTIGVVGPLRETVREVKDQSVAIGNQAIERVGTIAMWLSILALITLALSALGGMLGTPEESMMEGRTRGESYRADIRQAS